MPVPNPQLKVSASTFYEMLATGVLPIRKYRKADGLLYKFMNHEHTFLSVVTSIFQLLNIPPHFHVLVMAAKYTQSNSNPSIKKVEWINPGLLHLSNKIFV